MVVGEELRGIVEGWRGVVREELRKVVDQSWGKLCNPLQTNKQLNLHLQHDRVEQGQEYSERDAFAAGVLGLRRVGLPPASPAAATAADAAADEGHEDDEEDTGGHTRSVADVVLRPL